MNNFDPVDFSDRCSEEGMFLLMLSVVINSKSYEIIQVNFAYKVKSLGTSQITLNLSYSFVHICMFGIKV